jgi:hypothetical protein
MVTDQIHFSHGRYRRPRIRQSSTCNQ